MKRIYLVFSALVFAIASSQRALADGILPQSLVGQDDGLRISLHVFEYHEVNGESSPVLLLEQPQQIACAQRQLVEYEAAILLIQGGRTAVSDSFAKNDVQTRIALTDQRVMKEAPEGSSYLNLSSAPAAPTDHFPRTLLVNPELGVDSHSQVICTPVKAEEIARDLTRNKQLGLKLLKDKPSSSKTGVSAD